MMFHILLLLVSVVCVSAAYDTSDAHVSSHIVQTHEEVSAYWTKERMQSAIVKDITIDGEPTTRFPTKHQQHVQLNKSVDSYPFPYTSACTSMYNSYPYSTIGRIFYTQSNVDYVGSTSVVGEYLVLTSGDVVYDTKNNVWSTNVYIIPGYSSGYAPFGTFTYYKSFTSKTFITTRAQSSNYGFVVAYTNPNTGYAIGDACGMLTLAYNQTVDQIWRVIGYPTNPPNYSGNQICYSDSYLGAVDTTFGNFTIGVGNDGSSGLSGAAYVLYWGSLYWANSVVTYKYTNQPNAVYGPYFGTNVYAMYTTALNVIPPYN